MLASTISLSSRVLILRLALYSEGCGTADFGSLGTCSEGGLIPKRTSYGDSLVVACFVLRYTYRRSRRYSSQSPSLSVYERSRVRRERFMRSTRPLPMRCYGVVLNFLTPKSTHSSARILLSKFLPLSECSFCGGPSRHSATFASSGSCL